MVQSRMGSTRLPGKALKEIGGLPLVARICRRVELSELVNDVILVTTRDQAEQPMISRLAELGIDSFQGSTDDIVTRFHDAAIKFGADVVVRVWGDCPFVDPAVIDLAVDRLVAEKLDYCASFSPLLRSFPGGLDLEVYRMETLGRIRAESEDPFFREFPADYLQANESQFSIGYVEAESDYSRFNLSVDYPDDLKLARTLHTLLEQATAQGASTDFRSVVRLLENDPVLFALDQGQCRNAEYHAKRDKVDE